MASGFTPRGIRACRGAPTAQTTLRTHRVSLHPVAQVSITVLDESNHRCPAEETTTTYQAEGTHDGEDNYQRSQHLTKVYTTPNLRVFGMAQLASSRNAGSSNATEATFPQLARAGEILIFITFKTNAFTGKTPFRELEPTVCPFTYQVFP